MHSQVSVARSWILSPEFCVWGSCVSLVSVAVITVKSNLERKGFNLAYMSQSTHHWGTVPGDRNWSRGHGRRLPTGLHSCILLACSACFLIQPWSSAQWGTVLSGLDTQTPIINQENDPQSFYILLLASSFNRGFLFQDDRSWCQVDKTLIL